ncbi:MAG: Spy/CpxP family protein refolding chaperone [Verrucomicrobiales bacterium]|nr:Spy/CpxP family protein refolding chaperone [Verrucomicrobiales bacterium]
MKTRTLIWTLAAALAVGALGFGVAQANETARGRGRELLRRASEKLALTAEQRAAIKDVLVAEKDALKDLLIRLHDARKGLREAIRAQDATEASVRAAAARVAAVEADLAVARLKLHQRISPILTAEQREQVAKWEARLDERIARALACIGERRAQ